MNKQELIERIEGLKNIFGNKCEYVKIDFMIELVSELDEPEAGHADEAPRYVKNILARLRELPVHDREVWLKAIMGEFEQDFSHAKWREGYEQGKFEGSWVGQQLKDADEIRREFNKVKVKQFVADWYEENKDGFEGKLYQFVYNLTSIFDGAKLNEFERWFLTTGTKPFQTLINMHQFGYEVEKEKRYKISVKSNKQILIKFQNRLKKWFEFTDNKIKEPYYTRKELEEVGFGWVFDCPGIEVEEVE